MALFVYTAEELAGLLAEARSPETAPGRLEEIARLGARDVVDKPPELGAVVAANPNAPPRLLAELAPRHWEAFFRNPAGPLLPLEVPDFWAGLPVDGLRRALRAPDVPAWALGPLREGAARAADPWLRREAGLHVSYAGEAGPDWEGALRFELRRAAAEAGPDEREANAEMAELGLAPAWFLDGGDASAPLARIDASLLPRGSYLPQTDEERRELARIVQAAGDPATSRRRLRRIAEERREASPALAANPSVPADLLRSIADGCAGAASVWRALARNPGAPADLIRRGLGHPDAAVRRAARVHPAAPKRATETCRAAALSRALRWDGFRSLGHGQEGMAAPTPPLCRLAALLHPQAPLERLTAAARSDVWAERLAPCLRAGVAPGALVLLTSDGNLFVRAAARSRLSEAQSVFEW